MRPSLQIAICLVLGIVVGYLIATPARADTPVHGFTIPTVSEEVTSFPICTTTQNRQWSNHGSNDTQAMVCSSPTGALRTVSLEEAEEAAAFLSENINFAFDSATLGDEAYTAILVVGVYLKDEPADSLGLIGHADAVGPEKYNFGLSERRARAAQQLFVRMGIDPDRLTTLWVGEKDLLVDTPGPKLENRRVEIIIAH